MSITLDGTNGGTTSAGWYAQSAWSGTYTDGIVVDYVTGNGRITVGSADGLTIYNGGTSSRSALVTLDSSGNLGLGVTPSGWSNGVAFEIGGKGNAVWSYNGNYGDIRLFSNAYYNAGYKYAGSSVASAQYRMVSGAHYWDIAPSGTAGNAISFTQAMTLDASGNLLVGTTSQINSSKLCVQTASDYQLTLDATNTSTGYSGLYLTFAGTTKGSVLYSISNSRLTIANVSAGVYLASGGTSWISASDERFKADLKPILNAVEKVSTLRSVTGRYKTDEEGVSRSFLIAQDVQAVLPEAVDASDPDKLGVQYTDTIPLLVAAIKELTQRLEKLENQNG